MNYLKQTQTLTDDAVMAMLTAGRHAADQTGQPQCIVIVDASAVVLAEFRMAGAKVVSLRSARTKAQTAASLRPSGDAPAHPLPPHIAAAAGGIPGFSCGLPIRFGGECVGGIGVGSGTGEQDIAVANAALAAVGADPA